MRFAVLLILLPLVLSLASAAESRIGIIGTDTSHAVEFTRILNDAAGEDHVPGAHVVDAGEGGSRHGRKCFLPGQNAAELKERPLLEQIVTFFQTGRFRIRE
jgi:hypothetical protein